MLPIPKGTVYFTEDKDTLNEDNDANTIEESCENPSSSLGNELKDICKYVNEDDYQSKIENNKNEDFDKSTSSHANDECNMHMKKRMQRKRTRLLPQKDISRAVKQLDLK